MVAEKVETAAETGEGEDAEEVEENKDKEAKAPGRFGKLFLKLKTKARLIDHHSLEPNFKRNLEIMENYAECVNQLFTGYAALLQSNAELYKTHQVHESNPENNVHNHLAKYLYVLRDIGVVDWQVTGDKRKRCSFFNKDEKETLDGCVDMLRQLAKLETKYRDVALQYIKDTMEFLAGFRSEFMVEKAKLEQNLLVITELLPKIKKAKTNEELHEFGPRYEEAVNNFNRSSIDLTDFFIYNYPKFNYLHQRDLTKFHMARASYHEEAEELINTWLVKEDNRTPKPLEKTPDKASVEAKTLRPVEEKPKSTRAAVKKLGSSSVMKSPTGGAKRSETSPNKKPGSSSLMKKPETPKKSEEAVEKKKEQGSKRMSVLIASLNGKPSPEKKRPSRTRSTE